MNTPYPKNTPRFLGAAFVFVFFASLIGGILHGSALGVGPFDDATSISDVLVSVANNIPLLRISILIELANGVAIIVLAALLYVSLRHQNRTLSLVALGWWLAEAMMMFISKIGTYAMIPLSQQFVDAGTPASSHFQTLGTFLYSIMDEAAYDIHMALFCIGALLWYALLYRSRLVPNWLAGWGFVAVSLATVASLISLYDSSIDIPTLIYIPYIPFELFLGIWLMVKGFNPPDITSETNYQKI